VGDKNKFPSHCQIVRPWEPTRYSRTDHREVDGTYGHWYDDKDGRWFLPEWLSGSDYSGTLLEHANLRAFKEAFPSGEGKWWVEIYGGHGTFAVLVRTLAYRNCEEVREFFDSLEDYPCADDSLLSELECEAESEAWEQYGEKDFIKATKQKLREGLATDIDDYDDAIDAVCDDVVTSGEWWETWRELWDRFNVNGGTGYVNEQGDSIYFYIDEAVKRWDLALADGRSLLAMVRETQKPAKEA